MGSSDHVFDAELATRVRGLLKASITEDQAKAMDMEVTEDEIKSTLFAIISL